MGSVMADLVIALPVFAAPTSGHLENCRKQAGGFGQSHGCKEGRGSDGKDLRLTNPKAPRLITRRNVTLAYITGPDANGNFCRLPIPRRNFDFRSRKVMFQ
jgi:hypothetical protein